MEPNHCDKCKHGRKIKNYMEDHCADEDVIECHLNAPQFIRLSYQAIWPICKLDDYCSHFAPTREQQDKKTIRVVCTGSYGANFSDAVDFLYLCLLFGLAIAAILCCL